jgi:hypothetical protein
MTSERTDRSALSELSSSDTVSAGKEKSSPRISSMLIDSVRPEMVEARSDLTACLVKSCTRALVAHLRLARQQTRPHSAGASPRSRRIAKKRDTQDSLGFLSFQLLAHVGRNDRVKSNNIVRVLRGLKQDPSCPICS